MYAQRTAPKMLGWKFGARKAWRHSWCLALGPDIANITLVANLATRDSTKLYSLDAQRAQRTSYALKATVWSPP